MRVPRFNHAVGTSRSYKQQCKLSTVARDTLLTDINLDTVDMMTNFDGNENEPVVLPSRLPVRVVAIDPVGNHTLVMLVAVVIIHVRK